MGAAGVQADPFQQVGYPGFAFITGATGNLLRQGNVFADAERRNKIEELEHDTDVASPQQGACPLRSVIDGRPGKFNPAVIRPVDGCNSVQQRRLARPAGPHDGDQFPCLDVK